MMVCIEFKDTSKETWCGIANIMFDTDEVILIPENCSIVRFNLNDVKSLRITNRIY